MYINENECVKVNVSKKNIITRAHTLVQLEFDLDAHTWTYLVGMESCALLVLFVLVLRMLWKKLQMAGQHPPPSPLEVKLPRKLKWNCPEPITLKWPTWAGSSGPWECSHLWYVPRAAVILWDSKVGLDLLRLYTRRSGVRIKTKLCVGIMGGGAIRGFL